MDITPIIYFLVFLALLAIVFRLRKIAGARPLSARYDADTWAEDAQMMHEARTGRKGVTMEDMYGK